MSDLNPGTQIWVTSNTMFQRNKIPLLKGERLIAHFSMVVVMLGLYSNRMKTLLSQARSNALVEVSSGHRAGDLCHRPQMSSDTRFRLWVGASLGVCAFLNALLNRRKEVRSHRKVGYWGVEGSPKRLWLPSAPFPFSTVSKPAHRTFNTVRLWEIQSTLLWIRTCRQKTIIQSMLKNFILNGLFILCGE